MWGTVAISNRETSKEFDGEIPSWIFWRKSSKRKEELWEKLPKRTLEQLQQKVFGRTPADSKVNHNNFQMYLLEEFLVKLREKKILIAIYGKLWKTFQKDCSMKLPNIVRKKFSKEFCKWVLYECYMNSEKNSCRSLSPVEQLIKVLLNNRFSGDLRKEVFDELGKELLRENVVNELRKEFPEEPQ